MCSDSGTSARATEGKGAELAQQHEAIAGLHELGCSSGRGGGCYLLGHGGYALTRQARADKLHAAARRDGEDEQSSQINWENREQEQEQDNNNHCIY
jgi:hypothetical protein